LYAGSCSIEAPETSPRRSSAKLESIRSAERLWAADLSRTPLFWQLLTARALKRTLAKPVAAGAAQAGHVHASVDMAASGPHL
jgi:hypothetical protein